MIITVATMKGGSGKSTLASCLAVHWHLRGRHPTLIDADPQRSPWVTADDIRKKGAVVVWLASDTTQTPPPDIKTYFPDLVAELPRTFNRPVQGRLPVLRVGWGVIRPGSVAPAR